MSISSSNIKVYPSAFRTEQATFASLATEENITRAIKDLSYNFVIYTATPANGLKFYISGYYFEINAAGMTEILADFTNKPLYATISLDEYANNSGMVLKPASSVAGAPLDDNSSFIGITFSDTGPATESVTTLQLLDAQHTIPVKSFLRFPSTAIENTTIGSNPREGSGVSINKEFTTEDLTITDNVIFDASIDTSHDIIFPTWAIRYMEPSTGKPLFVLDNEDQHHLLALGQNNNNDYFLEIGNQDGNTLHTYIRGTVDISATASLQHNAIIYGSLNVSGNTELAGNLTCDNIFSTHITATNQADGIQLYAEENQGRSSTLLKANYNGCVIRFENMGATSIFTVSDEFSLNPAGGIIHINNEHVIIDDGDITADSYNALSDRRLKENIKTFIPHKSILDLDVVEFDFKSDKSHHIGCIAQELQEICPEIVHENENGYLSIEENKIVYLLLEEVKELKKEIEELKGE